MGSLLDNAGRTLLLGAGITVAILLLWIAVAGFDPIGFLGYLLRFLHIYAAMVWVGLIVFVNFVQLAVAADASPEGRALIMNRIAPPVSAAMRHSSHLTLLTGVIMLVSSGYLLDRLVFSTPVYVPPLRNMLLWGGTLGGLAMWAFLNFIIGPKLKVLAGDANAATKDAARRTIKTYARINLVLSLPVTAVMVAAAHLY